jgi:fatty-acid peroxygenase
VARTAEMPRDAMPDSTLALLADPYRFISERSRRFGPDAFEASLFFERTLCMVGEDSARVIKSPRPLHPWRSGAGARSEDPLR